VSIRRNLGERIDNPGIVLDQRLFLKPGSDPNTEISVVFTAVYVLQMVVEWKMKKALYEAPFSIEILWVSDGFRCAWA
jgi:hypothetical protein